MNRGLNFYGILLVTIATLVFSVNEFGVAHATTGIDLGNNPAQFNQIPNLNSDPNDNDDNNNDKSSGSSDNNNDKSSSSSSSSSSDNNNDKSSGSSSSSSSATTTTTTATTSNDDVPMVLPFNSNMADESDDEKDYSSVIPFP
ncbi:hypothetical protein BH23THE1_BH23THE1_09340 [soil metagenome]